MFVTLKDKTEDKLHRISSIDGIYTLICDEAHQYISEKNSQEFKAIRKMNNVRIILMSGTVHREW